MSENDEHATTPRPRLVRLLCKRTGQQIPPDEHERCPYCFGKLAQVETGRHETFCDYREGVDPVHFGSPTTDRRFEQG